MIAEEKIVDPQHDGWCGQVLRAAALVARRGGGAASVVVPREAGMVTLARGAADQAGVDAQIEIGADAVIVRFLAAAEARAAS